MNPSGSRSSGIIVPPYIIKNESVLCMFFVKPQGATVCITFPNKHSAIIHSEFEPLPQKVCKEMIEKIDKNHQFDAYALERTFSSILKTQCEISFEFEIIPEFTFVDNHDQYLIVRIFKAQETVRKEMDLFHITNSLKLNLQLKKSNPMKKNHKSIYFQILLVKK